MANNSRRNIILPILLSVALAAGILIGKFSYKSDALSRLNSAVNMASAPAKLSSILNLIRTQYVDPVDMDSLTEKILPLIIDKLDPHSAYIPAKDMQAVNEPLDGEFDGVGIFFNMMTDTIVVMNVIPGGPSQKAGILNGDRVVRINDSLVAGRQLSSNDVMKLLRGPRGTTVNLSVERQSVSGLVPITVTRDKIPVTSIDASFIIRPGIGFVKLSTFSRNSVSELREALLKLREEGMEKLIFDLRGNGGGYMDQAIYIANEFLGPNRLIVYTIDRNGKRTQEFSRGNGTFADLPLVLLIDEMSASSSEIIAGAIQDNDRGTIVGRRSFGKGLVQHQIPFNDGSGLRLTVARYYTPTGRSIQKPYVEGETENYLMDIANRYDHNEFFTADSIKFADSLRFTTPKGNVVYGGGGIMPDIFVPMDTTGVTPYLTEVAGRNIIARYSLDYTDRHRGEINGITTLQDIRTMFRREGDDKLLEDFVSYAAGHGVAPDREDIAVSRSILLAQLKSSIGNNTPLGYSAFYDNIYHIDNAILEAIKAVGTD